MCLVCAHTHVCIVQEIARRWYCRRQWLHGLVSVGKGNRVLRQSAKGCDGATHSNAPAPKGPAPSPDTDARALLLDSRLARAHKGGLLTSHIAGLCALFLPQCCEEETCRHARPYSDPIGRDSSEVSGSDVE